MFDWFNWCRKWWDEVGFITFIAADSLRGVRRLDTLLFDWSLLQITARWDWKSNLIPLAGNTPVDVYLRLTA